MNWVFALKYWNLSHRLKAITAGTDQTCYNKVSRIILVTIVALMIVFPSVFIWACYREKSNIMKEHEGRYANFAKQWARCFALTPCITAFLILLDAFRRMNGIKEGNSGLNPR